MDWSIPVYVAVVELDRHDEDKDQQVRDLLESKVQSRLFFSVFAFARLLQSRPCLVALLRVSTFGNVRKTMSSL